MKLTPPTPTPYPTHLPHTPGGGGPRGVIGKGIIPHTLPLPPPPYALAYPPPSPPALEDVDDSVKRVELLRKSVAAGDRNTALAYAITAEEKQSVLKATQK